MELARTVLIFQKVNLRDGLICSDQTENFYGSLGNFLIKWHQTREEGISKKFAKCFQGPSQPLLLIFIPHILEGIYCVLEQIANFYYG